MTNGKLSCHLKITKTLNLKTSILERKFSPYLISNFEWFNKSKSQYEKNWCQILVSKTGVKKLKVLQKTLVVNGLISIIVSLKVPAALSTSSLIALNKTLLLLIFVVRTIFLAEGPEGSTTNCQINSKYVKIENLFFCYFMCNQCRNSTI